MNILEHEGTTEWRGFTLEWTCSADDGDYFNAPWTDIEWKAFVGNPAVIEEHFDEDVRVLFKDSGVTLGEDATTYTTPPVSGDPVCADGDEFLRNHFDLEITDLIYHQQ